MNSSFKTVFHNGEPGEKPIVTMSVTINSSKRLNRLDANGLKNLYEELYRFSDRVEVAMDEVKEANRKKAG